MRRIALIILVPLILSCVAAMKYVPHRRAAFRVPFQPTDVANMIAWYDASTIASGPGTAIATWEDQGPNGYDLVQSTAANRPYITNNASQINNEKFLYFDGSNDYMIHGASTVYSQPNTFFIVFDCYGGGSAYMLYDGTNVSTRNTAWDSAGTQMAMYGGASLVAPLASKVANQWYLFEFTFNGASSSMITNEVSHVSGNAGAVSFSGLNVGRAFNNTLPYIGGIAELIIYNANVSASDRTLLHTYFKDKYGAYASW